MMALVLTYTPCNKLLHQATAVTATHTSLNSNQINVNLMRQGHLDVCPNPTCIHSLMSELFSSTVHLVMIRKATERVRETVRGRLLHRHSHLRCRGCVERHLFLFIQSFHINDGKLISNMKTPVYDRQYQARYEKPTLH